MPDDAPWPEPVVIPDDLRDLQAEIDAYHRERRAAARRRRLARVTGTRGWDRFALPAGIALVSMAVAAGVFGILVLGQPRPDRGVPQAPLAAAAAAEPGRLHGLLPDVNVVSGGHTIALRDQRPALIAIVPLHCDCTSLLRDMAAQANEVGLHLVVVAPGEQDAEVAALEGQLHNGFVTPVFDAGGLLAASYSARGVTALVVRPDGTVSYIQYDVQRGDHHLDGALSQFLLPVASISSR